MASQPKRPWRRGLWVFVGISVVLHLLLLFLPGRPARPRGERFLVTQPWSGPPDRPFPVTRPETPERQMRRLAEGVPETGPPAPSMPSTEEDPLSRMGALRPTPYAEPGARPLEAPAPAATAYADLDSLAIADAVLEIEGRDEYARLWVPDADTTDADSGLRRKARRIVEGAIRAMGGRARLDSIHEMRARVWIEAWEHVRYASLGRTVRTREVVNVGTYLFPVLDQRFSRLDRSTNHPLSARTTVAIVAQDQANYWLNPEITLRRYRKYEHRFGFLPERDRDLRETGETARWHFVDRFLGEGVELRYKGIQMLRQEPVQVVLVSDQRYGQYLEAFFSRHSGLLIATKEGLTPAEQRWFRQTFRKPPPTWTTKYLNYTWVQGVLRPLRMTRSGSTEFVSLRFSVGYNGDPPDLETPRD